MRILHTSDWHLGRSFHGEDLLAAQAAYVDHLIETVEAEGVDLVVVAGDVYDRALPPVDAVALADDAFRRLATSRAQVVVTSGNHDSARRLGFNARLVELAGLHLRTDAGRVDEPVLLDDEHGQVAVYGIPYLEPDVLRHAWQLSTRSHHAALGHAMELVRADLASPPDRHPLGGGGARLRRRRAGQRQRARHRGGRCLRRARRALRRHRLHRPRTPARPRDPGRVRPLQRVPDRLLVLARRARSRGPGWSTSAPTG